MPLHPAWLKNIARRVLWAALENDISKDERAAMLKHFEGGCAYCRVALGNRWHADHVVAVDKGGFNHVSNRVPSCARCNEQEKREMDWLEFLKSVCGSDSQAFKMRERKIIDWRNAYLPAVFPVTEDERAAWKTEVETLTAAIDASWRRLKNLKRGVGG